MEIRARYFIVTGGASGLGEGTARMLAAHGGKVVLADMQADKRRGGRQGARRRLREMRRQPGSRRAGRGRRAAALGKLMGLVNCAGIAPAVKTVGKDGAAPAATLPARPSRST